MLFKLKLSIYALFISGLIYAGNNGSVEDRESVSNQSSGMHALVRAQSLVSPLGLRLSFDKRYKSAPTRRKLALEEEPRSALSLFRAKYGLSNVDRRRLASVLASFTSMVTNTTGSRTSRDSSDSLVFPMDLDYRDPRAGRRTPEDINSLGFVSAAQTPRENTLKPLAPEMKLTSPGGTTITISSSNTSPSDVSTEGTSSPK